MHLFLPLWAVGLWPRTPTHKDRGITTVGHLQPWGSVSAWEVQHPLGYAAAARAALMKGLRRLRAGFPVNGVSAFALEVPQEQMVYCSVCSSNWSNRKARNHEHRGSLGRSRATKGP